MALAKCGQAVAESMTRQACLTGSKLKLEIDEIDSNRTNVCSLSLHFRVPNVMSCLGKSGLALPFGPFELVASYYLYLHLNIRRHENNEIIILSRQLTKKLGPGYRELHVVARLQARIRRNSCPETLESFVQEAA